MNSGRIRALYICYLSLSDPLVHTQVIAYLKGLVADGHRLHLLTFEPAALSRRERRQWRESLAAEGIAWHHLRYHKRPSLPATMFDTFAGAACASALIRRYRLDALHARNHVPAAMALIARSLSWPRRPALIFDIRGLMAEEYEDAGRWARDSIASRVTRAVQAAAIRRAAAIVVLTERVRSLLFGDGPNAAVHVIPCCADVPALTAPPDARERIRAQLGVGDAPVMVYVGKFTGWYMEREMVEFFALAREVLPDLHFLILTQSERDVIVRELRGYELADQAYTVMSVPPDRVGECLAAADFAISFIRPVPSKVASSPTKIGEYLVAGRPVVSTAGVGDLDRLLTPDVGVLVSEHNPAAYRAALTDVLQLVSDPDTAGRCRELAERQLSLSEVGIPRYRALYRQVTSQ